MPHAAPHAAPRPPTTGSLAAWVAAGAVALAGCAADRGGLGVADASSRDLGTEDLGSGDLGAVDLGVEDLGSGDLGADDLGAFDMGDTEAGPVDMATPDAGAVDMGAPDAGPPDSGPADAGVRDLGATDMAGADLGRPDASTLSCDPATTRGCVCPMAEAACRLATSCREVRDEGASSGNNVYTLDGDGTGGRAPAEAYCDMTEGGGGWTLVLKVDGNSTTYGYDAALWTNDVLDGTPGFDGMQGKVAAYLNVRFTEVRLLFDTGGTRRSLVLPVAGESMRELMGRGRVTTSAMKMAWLNLVPNGRLQNHCNQQGFNVAPEEDEPRVRIGFLANEQMDCNSPDSWVGVGGWHYDTGLTAGNVARYAGGGNERTTASFVYVFVR